MREAPTLSILTSGIGLGVYIPSLLIARQVREHGIEAEVVTLESYYTDEGRAGHQKHQQAFRQDFALAQIANRMARGVDGRLDEAGIAALLTGWAAERRRHFVVWSGFWLPVLERYKAILGERVHVDCCRIDAAVSASFRPYADLEAGSTEIWLWHWEERRLVHQIAVDERPPMAFGQRAQRLVVHGGGWGIGTYREVRADLADTSWALDTVVHDEEEAVGGRSGDRFFRVDPTWRTWQLGPEGHTFPPFGEVGLAIDPRSRHEHALYDVIRGAQAIVSKPGGGTLIDSLSSSTPVVLLEPYGAAEARSGALWEHLGFGIPYATWKATGHRAEVLAGLHENLVRARRQGIDYPRFCVERLRNGGWA